MCGELVVASIETIDQLCQHQLDWHFAHQNLLWLLIRKRLFSRARVGKYLVYSLRHLLLLQIALLFNHS